MHKQLGPQWCFGKECISIWVHSGALEKICKQLSPRCSKKNAQAARSTMLPWGKLRKQLGPQCPREKYTSSWVHNTSRKMRKQLDLQCPGLPRRKICKQLDPQCLRENAQTAGSTMLWKECASSQVYGDALKENTQAAGSTIVPQGRMPKQLGPQYCLRENAQAAEFMEVPWRRMRKQLGL